MPDSMYDKLGDLLSRTLDTGEIPFVKVEASSPSEESSSKTEPRNLENGVSSGVNADAKDEGPSEKKDSPEETETEFAAYANKTKKKNDYTIYKYVPPEISACYALLGISHGADKKQIKEAYKQKLKALHPDRYSKDADMEEKANVLTQQLVEAYKKITVYLKG